MSKCSPEIPNMRWVYRGRLGVSIALSMTNSLAAVHLAARMAIAVGGGVLASSAMISADEIRPSGTNTYQKVTGDGAEEDRKHWDKLYSSRNYIFGKEPARFIEEHIDLLPPGRGLDLAMGEGRNAVYLAKKGFQVDGVDISEVALKKAKRLARENRVSIHTLSADLASYLINPESYTVILNIDYLQRNLIPQIKRGLRKKGVVVFENLTEDQLKNAGGKNLRRDALLRKGELREFFKDFEILVYREVNDGKFAKASLIARKP